MFKKIGCRWQMVPLFNLTNQCIGTLNKATFFANVMLWYIRIKASYMHLQDTLHNVWEWIFESIVEYRKDIKLLKVRV